MYIDKVHLFEDYYGIVEKSDDSYYKYDITICKGEVYIQVTPYGGKLTYVTNDYKDFARRYSKDRLIEDIKVRNII